MTTVAVFGPGQLYVTRNDAAASGAQLTPINIGYIQEFSYDESAENKELFGQNQYPLVVARGTIKATGKMKIAMVSGIALNTVWHAQTLTANSLSMTTSPSTAIPATPFQITPAIPAGGTAFDTDLGVINAVTGIPLTIVPLLTTPTAGEYHVDPATGIYTFSSADNVSGVHVKITFAYTTTAGQNIVVANTPIGTTPSFQIDYMTSLYGKPYYVRMYNAVSTKLVRAHKLVDFMMPEIDFGFFQNAAGNVYEEGYPEAS